MLTAGLPAGGVINTEIAVVAQMLPARPTDTCSSPARVLGQPGKRLLRQPCCPSVAPALTLSGLEMPWLYSLLQVGQWSALRARNQVLWAWGLV